MKILSVMLILLLSLIISREKKSTNPTNQVNMQLRLRFIKSTMKVFILGQKNYFY